ncbi:hypothetical protein [Streptomyces benahoarensis]|uniref:Uncharacterized protein n=1 Tax=Streptomyces benahoarensis TaxID=2595054 RepID=A0A553Z1N2_9ACTN|nr:hypothetical protein [Streptomyces benahoarensis]TSB31877.1 hypothetical protein FNJ62_04235 [Streptomyces benahoarensis]TSB35398.1 hypothetical protein FNZ23_21225 [Streptomyces benahoarensis]
MTADHSAPPGFALDGAAGDSERAFTYATGGMRLTGLVRTDSSKPRLAAITAVPADPGKTLSAAQIKSIPTGALLAAVQSLLGIERQAADSGEMSASTPSRRTRAGSDDLLRELAEVYLEETAPGRPRGHLDRIAVRLGWPKNTVSTRLARARKQGWLGPAINGRAGSDPGPRLIAARHAEQASIGPAPDEGPNEREARQHRMLDFAERAGNLYDEIFSEGREPRASNQEQHPDG